MPPAFINAPRRPRHVGILRIAYGGAGWISTSLGAAILMAGVSGIDERLAFLLPLSLVPFFFFMFGWFFFRDPERRIGDDIVSGADGKVVLTDQVDDPDLGRCDRLAVFMSPFDVHVNRFPLAADVRSVQHIPGKHVPAFNKDSERNERVIMRLKTDLGDVKVVQIAGAVARRIVPYADGGDHVHKGDKLGLIRIGSRFDVIIPVGRVRWTVETGQRVLAGTSRIAKVVEGDSAAV